MQAVTRNLTKSQISIPFSGHPVTVDTSFNTSYTRIVTIIIRLVLAICICVSFTACERNDLVGSFEQDQKTDRYSTTADIEQVTALRIIAADDEPENWLSHGRSYDEQRFSPLRQINTDTVSSLGLSWYYDFPTTRGLEATPLVQNGIMFSTGSWSIVYAHDATSGELLWQYNPEVPRSREQFLCCGPVNRGVALWGQSVFFGTLDGRLISLDAKTGAPNWSVQTTASESYSITGAPRVIKGNVIIGNGGAEFGVRGYVTAYDAETGKEVWRFYTVPGNPDDGYESPAIEKAAATWKGEWWKLGGGGTVWDSMAFDPDLNLLYIGTGNGSPWNQQIRSPGGGDNLYLSSIIALKPDSGEYVWHYQTTPGEVWDYTAAQHMILADVEIEGQLRPVIMQAPKNGFFYVLDRRTGEFISANNYVPVNWASHIDSESGRPVESADARYGNSARMTLPAPMGGHNWQPMAFSPQTGLVYIPAQEISWQYTADQNYRIRKGHFNTGTDVSVNEFPPDPEMKEQILRSIRGHLSAWDPVEQREIWRAQYPDPWNGGVLATAGGLVFQGDSNGYFSAYDADSGTRLWRSYVGTGVIAAPISFAADGEQYIAILAGWGGTWALAAGEPAAKSGVHNVSRLLVFRLNAKTLLPDVPTLDKELLYVNSEDLKNADLETGKSLYFNLCGRCHGFGAVSGGVLPDLRYLHPEKLNIWDEIVLSGMLSANGMPAFKNELTKSESEAIKAYVLSRADASRL